GPDGTIWYVDSSEHCIARLTAAGSFNVISTYSQKENQFPGEGIAYGPGGDIWFTESGNNGLGWVDPSKL
ncbi:MAG TPA: hypothetical protein VGF18_09510, partial [Candidatus Tumulicola sp.]